MSKVSFDFYNENFVVAGASSGMGREVAMELAAAGANVLAIARRKEKLETLAKDFPDNIVVAVADVCETNAMEEAVASFVQSHGKLHGGIYAAGVLGITPLKQFNREEAHKIMDTSFWGALDFLQICTKVSNSEKCASFVLFSSVDAVAGEKGKFAYSAAKMALNSAVKSVAKEVARRGQRINTILPGWVDTEMTSNVTDMTNMDSILRRQLLGIGKPEYVVGQILFLLCDRAAWITGTNVVVDGGYLA